MDSLSPEIEDPFNVVLASGAGNILLGLDLMIGPAARLAACNFGKPEHWRYHADAYRQLIAFESEHDSYDRVRANERFHRAMTRLGVDAVRAQALPVRAGLRLACEHRFTDYRRTGEAILNDDEQGAESAARRGMGVAGLLESF